MKRILVIAIVALFSTNNWAQNLLKPTQTEITSLPTWAQLMYSDNPSIFEVDNLFREYYKINNYLILKLI